MSRRIPFRVSDNNYTLVIPVDNVPILFEVHWNSQEDNNVGGWYMSLYEQNQTPIATGIKIVLGVNLGRRSTHPFFRSYLLRAFDTSGQNKDPGFDDLGNRVIVKLFTVQEILDQLP